MKFRIDTKNLGLDNGVIIESDDLLSLGGEVKKYIRQYHHEPPEPSVVYVDIREVGKTDANIKDDGIINKIINNVEIKNDQGEIIDSKEYLDQYFKRMEQKWSFNPKTDLPICNYCKHYIVDLHCKAFPDPKTIPDEILNCDHKHSSIFPGQTGDYVFTPIK